MCFIWKNENGFFKKSTIIHKKNFKEISAVDICSVKNMDIYQITQSKIKKGEMQKFTLFVVITLQSSISVEERKIFLLNCKHCGTRFNTSKELEKHIKYYQASISNYH